MNYEANLKAHYAKLTKKLRTPHREPAPPIIPLYVPPPAPSFVFIPLPEVISFRRIAKLISAQSLIGIIDIKSKRRTADIVRERHRLIYLNRLFTRRSLTEIGRELCLDHTSVLHALRKVAERRLVDSVYDLELNELEQLLGGDDAMVRRKESMVGPTGRHGAERAANRQRDGNDAECNLGRVEQARGTLRKS